MPGHALRALAAEHRKAGDDVIARLHIGYVVADCFDDTGGLVAEHARCRERIQPFHEVQVRMAKSRERGAYQHLTPLQRRVLDVLDGQRLVRFMQYGGLHGFLRILCARTLPLGRRCHKTICVCVTLATSRPSALVILVSQTCVRRPRCSGTASAIRRVPTGEPAKKLVLLSIVVVP